jgi:succinate-semialdehyde dehydrogenase/glutarate-semialdehyde dehydrogenase
MNAAADIFENDIEHHAHLMTLEMGKTHREARSEIEKCALCCRYYAENAEKFLKDVPLNVNKGKAYIHYNPIGTVLAVMPWNFPYWQVIRFAAPNLMAGNVGLLKHASSVPQISLAIEDVFRQADFPEGVFQSLLISGKKTEQVIKHSAVKAATLTGSEKAGGTVAALAGKHIKKTVLELGGSDPFIVLEDADINTATDWAVKSRMVNNGQSCIAAKRFIVVGQAYEPFLEQFTQKMKKLKIGDPTEEEFDYGPMAQESLAKDLLEQVEKSVKAGANVQLGGTRPDREGAFFNPTILTNIPKDSPAYDEELFGPVASVFNVSDEKEAIKLANNSRFGLGGSVWTADKERGRKVAEKVESGAVYVNKMMASDPAVPFGGIKTSGYGRELSHLGIHEFMNQKSIWIGE